MQQMNVIGDKRAWRGRPRDGGASASRHRRLTKDHDNRSMSTSGGPMADDFRGLTKPRLLLEWLEEERSVGTLTDELN